MLSLFPSLIVALSLAAATPEPVQATAPLAAEPAIALNVPYLPQTEAMCGGAAAAMVLRYWGDAHAGEQQFDALVDRRAGGIATTTLVAALEQRQWRTFRTAASVDALRDELRAQRPDSAGPLRELAGVRFAARRWHESASLAEQALARDPRDEYAWDVLASSRFMQDDVAGALRAWNRIDKPRVDTVQIEGLSRARYALVADALALPAGALVSEETFRP